MANPYFPKLTRGQAKGLRFSFGVLGFLGGARQVPAPWKGQPCQARAKRKSEPPCGKGAITVRTYEAAPGMWLHVVLCHRHGYVWDQADAWGGGIPIRERPCNGGCSKGDCRGESEEPRKPLWLTEGEIEDLHAALNHLYDEDSYQHSRCGADGIKNMNTQLRDALKRFAE